MKASLIPIELKYKRDGATVEDKAFGEVFELTQMRDYDRAHYNFFSDVKRIEELVRRQGRYGYVVLLRNSNYWTQPLQSAKYDEFRVHEGETEQGPLQWSDISDWMVTEGRADPIELDGEYTMEWTDFTNRDDIHVSGHPRFRYLDLRVD